MSNYPIVGTLGVPVGRLRLISDEAANDSDKTITVDSGKRWKVLWIWIEFTTTATVGNRNIYIRIRDDADDEIYIVIAKNVQAASAVEMYSALPGLGYEALEGKAGWHFLPLPRDLILPGGYDIRIHDGNAVDAAADDLIIHMMVLETA